MYGEKVRSSFYIEATFILLSYEYINFKVEISS